MNVGKLLEKVRNSPNNIRFKDVCKLAEIFGFTFRGGKGSHRIYTKKEIVELLNFQNVNGKAKPYQVKQLLKIIDDYKLEVKR